VGRLAAGQLKRTGTHSSRPQLKHPSSPGVQKKRRASVGRGRRGRGGK
jgi:hypothetical protein